MLRAHLFEVERSAPSCRTDGAVGSIPTALPPNAILLTTLDVNEAERILIERALVATNGNRTRAAKLLGISVRTLRNKLNLRPRENEKAPAAVGGE
jgi:DNA-binding NtrC family response regulator